MKKKLQFNFQLFSVENNYLSLSQCFYVFFNLMVPFFKLKNYMIRSGGKFKITHALNSEMLKSMVHFILGAITFLKAAKITF